MSGLTFHPQVLRLRAPLFTAHGAVHVREGWIVRFEAEGVSGWGEALPLPAFGTEALEDCGRALARARDQLGDGLADPEALEAVLAPFAETPTARFALESALLDWLARREGRPVATLLGEVQRPTVEVNALLGGETLNALVASARDARGAGFQTAKLKVGGRPIKEDVARVFAVREALGSALRLRVDANGAWSQEEAIEALTAMAPAGLELCEQPTPPAALEALAAVHARGLCALAADETLLVPEAFEWLLHHRACDVLVLKPMALGGLLRSAAWARRAADAGLDAYVTSFLDGDLGRAAAAQLASVLPTAKAHGLATGALLDAPTHAGWLQPKDGRLTVSSSPGLGVEGPR